MVKRKISAELEAHLADVDTAAAPGLIALDAAVRKAHADLDVAIKCRLLRYALHGDWRNWVCAIGPTRQGVCLRFLYGALLDDPLRVLRPGSAHLMTGNFKTGEAIDPDAVERHATEAVRRYEYFKANARQVKRGGQGRRTGAARRTAEVMPP